MTRIFFDWILLAPHHPIAQRMRLPEPSPPPARPRCPPAPSQRAVNTNRNELPAFASGTGSFQ